MEGEAILGATRTDADLAAAGDRAAFARLVVANNRSMERVAYVIVGDAQLTQDAVQSAWLIAWQRIPGLREPGRVGAWLVAIAANEARQIARKRHRTSVRELHLDAAHDARREPTVTTDDIHRVDLVQAMARLRPEDRELLALRYVAGFDAAELGRLTGRSASGVRGRLSRLTTNLRKELNRG